MDQLANIVTGTNLSLAIAVNVILVVIRTLAPEAFKTPIGQRILPVLPILLGLPLAMLLSDIARWQDRLVMGFLVGFVASTMFKVGRTSILGMGLDIATKEEPKPEDPKPEAPKADAPTAPAP